MRIAWLIYQGAEQPLVLVTFSPPLYLLYASCCLLSQSFSDTSPNLQIEQTCENRGVFPVYSCMFSVRLIGVTLNSYC